MAGPTSFNPTKGSDFSQYPTKDKENVSNSVFPPNPVLVGIVAIAGGALFFPLTTGVLLSTACIGYCCLSGSSSKKIATVDQIAKEQLCSVDLERKASCAHGSSAASALNVRLENRFQKTKIDYRSFDTTSLEEKHGNIAAHIQFADKCFMELVAPDDRSFELVTGNHQLFEVRPGVDTPLSSIYLDQPITIGNSTVNSEASFFDHRNRDSRFNHVNTIFGAYKASGHLLVGGIAQEEIEYLKNAQLMMLADQEIALARTGGSKGAVAGKGSPKCFAIKGCTLTTENTAKYPNVALAKLEKPITGVNYISIAAPNNVLKPKDQSLVAAKFSLETQFDLLNTACAGFEAAKTTGDDPSQETLVHTGLWGCGMFQQEPLVSICMQIYAAKLTGVHLTFHGISGSNVGWIVLAKGMVDELFADPNIAKMSKLEGLKSLHEKLNAYKFED